MYQLVSKYMFANIIHNDENNNISYEGAGAIFDYLEQCESGTGMELDVIAIRCDFAEANIIDFMNEFGIDYSECEDEDEYEQLIADYIEYRGTWYSILGDSIVYEQF